LLRAIQGEVKQVKTLELADEKGHQKQKPAVWHDYFKTLLMQIGSNVAA